MADTHVAWRRPGRAALACRTAACSIAGRRGGGGGGDGGVCERVLIAVPRAVALARVLPTVETRVSREARSLI